MIYAHTNLRTKQEAVKVLAPTGDNVVTMPRKAHQGLSTVTRKV
jgi:hypothetical protein